MHVIVMAPAVAGSPPITGGVCLVVQQIDTLRPIWCPSHQTGDRSIIIYLLKPHSHVTARKK